MTPRSGSTPFQWQGFNEGPGFAGGASTWPSVAPVKHPKRQGRLKGKVTQQRQSAKGVTERMVAENWPSTASFLFAHGHDLQQRSEAALRDAARQLSGSCPVGSACDDTTGPLHPTIAELRLAVAADYKVVLSRGLRTRRSLDGLIVLIGEHAHNKPDAATRALQGIWKPGDLHFAELPDPYLRSGQLNHFLRGIPIEQTDTEGGSVGMDDFELGLQLESLMGEVAAALLELIDRLASQVRPGAPSGQQASVEATLPELRRQRDALWTEYRRRHIEPGQEHGQILGLRERVSEQETQLEEMISGTLEHRSDYMVRIILGRVHSDRSTGASPRRAYVAVPGAAHLQRMAELLQQNDRRYVLLCPHAVSRLIDVCG